jgi:membrane protein implicated in regulation of membrane protease activity
MWILHFLPDAVILWFGNILLLVGVVLTAAGLFAHRIPLVWQYQLPFKILGIALLVLGVYFRGGYAVEAEWRERVAEVEARLAVAEQKSAEANIKIDTTAREKIRIIRGQTQIVRQYIDREVVKYDTKFLPGGQCEIPQEFIQAHNKSTERTK